MEPDTRIQVRTDKALKDQATTTPDYAHCPQCVLTQVVHDQRLPFQPRPVPDEDAVR